MIITLDRVFEDSVSALGPDGVVQGAGLMSLHPWSDSGALAVGCRALHLDQVEEQSVAQSASLLTAWVLCPATGHGGAADN